MSFPAAECEAGAACATPTNNACRTRPAIKGKERQRPLSGGRGRRYKRMRKWPRPDHRLRRSGTRRAVPDRITRRLR